MKYPSCNVLIASVVSSLFLFGQAGIAFAQGVTQKGGQEEKAAAEPSRNESDSKSDSKQSEGADPKEEPAGRTASQTDTTELPDLRIVDLSKTKLILVVGVPGEDQYFEQFRTVVEQWNAFVEKSGCELVLIGNDEPEGSGDKGSDRDSLLTHLRGAASSTDPLWVVFVGHGTFDGSIAKFNLRGEDVTAAEMAKSLQDREHLTVVVNCASSSAPFVNRLSAPNRVVISATKSGSQYNATRFGVMFAKAIANPENDLDKDGQVSLLETFIAASSDTQDFYNSENRIATETAILDDNADQKGTPADWFSGVRCVKKAKNTEQVDGVFANQIFLAKSDSVIALTEVETKKRAELEAALEKLVANRKQFAEEDFLREVEPILLDLARLYASKTDE